MIQAYPDPEYKRLSKAVLDMPINNADDCKERFPKELPRRLFPRDDNLQAQQRCAAALSADGTIPLRKAPTFPPPPPMGAPTGSLERERNPYGGQTESAAIDEDEDDVPLTVPIERERKPYVSAPGGGKLYDDSSMNSNNSLKLDTELHQRHHRSQSSASQSNWPPSNSKPSDYIPSNSSRHYTGSHMNGRRARSPSFSNYGTRSDTNIVDVPPYYSTSNIYDSEDDNRKFSVDGDSRRSDWARRQAEDDAPAHRRNDNGSSGGGGAYTSQPRPVYDDEYYPGRSGSNGYDNKSYSGQYLPPRY